MPGVTSALAERLVGGRYLDIDIQREKAARYGMTVGDVQLFVSSAIGGAMVGETVEGVERYPINIRYPQSYRDSPQTLRQLPILTPLKQQIVLGDVAEVKVVSGPSMLKTENARPTSWIYIDARDRDMVSVVHDLQQAIGKEVKLKPGISVSYSGQFELLERANQKLKLMVPMTLMIIFVLLYTAFRRVGEALLIIASVPFALVGGIWFLYWMGFHLSVATRHRLYRHGRRGRGVWRGDADVPAPRHRGGAGAGEPADLQRREARRGAVSGGSTARAAEGDDRGGDYRRSAADFVGHRRRVGGDEPHRRADDWRNDHRPAAVAVYYSGGV